MSGFQRLLQAALARVNPRWAREFEQVVREEEVVSRLERLRKLGGDPNFALFTLTDYRWRRIKPLRAPRDRNRLLRALRLLLEDQGEWSEQLRTLGGSEWKAIGPVLRQALTNLESFRPVEESVFKTSGTRYDYETPGLLSDRATTCLVVLHWHVQQASGKRRTDLVLLGGLMDAFGLIPRSRAKPSADPARWVEKRLERAAKKDDHGHSPQEFTQKFVVFPLVMAYHDVHESAGLACGSGCRPFERAFRTAGQEGLLYEVDRALGSMHTDEPVAAVDRLRQLLEKADRLLGPNHAGLVPLLEGYAKVLRAAGRRSTAITVAKRIAAVLVAARRRRQDLIGFQPGAGPAGELLPVWREPDAISGPGESESGP
jgi:hypothetical protein